MLFFWSNMEANAQKLEWIKEYHDNNKVKTAWQVLLENPKIFQGKYYQYYPTGILKTDGNYLKNKQNGLWKYFYENGQLKVECQYLNGQMNGSYKNYNENGSLSKEGQMQGSIPAGLWKQYYETGTIKNEGNYFKGKISGTWVNYYEEGTKKSISIYEANKARYQEFYENGRLKMEGILRTNASDSIWKYYYENGKLKATGIEKNGLKNGNWIFYYDDGKIESEGSYSSGTPTGSWKYYHANGKISSVGKFNNGQKDGEWKLYFESGALQGEGVFASGNGTYQEFYESGKLKVKGKVEEGQYVGNWVFYDENGVREGICEYESGLGIYTGYYLDGKTKMTGTLRNSEKIGTWKLYDSKGDLTGTYRSYSDAMKAPQAYVPITYNEKSTSTIMPRAQLKRQFYFLPRSYEFTKLNISINPLAIALNSFPVYIEYIIPNRTGLELTFTYIKSPMFGNFNSPGFGSTYTRGYSINIGPKFYKRDRGSGSIFFKPCFRYSDLQHLYNFSGNTTSRLYDKLYTGTEKLYEITLLGGWKMLRPMNNGNYLTFEIFAGPSIAYRNLKKGDAPLEVFSDIPDTENTIIFRFGGSIGFCF
jgi:antitoxin component YwqK of YwqJK toxin-antitoxin module